MLDDVELQQVQKIESEDEAAVQAHSIPALEGDFLQDLGRRSTRVDLTGVLSGPDAGKGLQKLREKFQKAEPMSFVADIATATAVDKVMIEQMEVEELAGKPERFAYALSVLEFVPPPKQETEPPPPPPPPPPKIDKGTLIVEVIVTGQPEFDFSTVTVSVKGNQDDGSPFERTLTNRKDNVWTDEAMPPGSYTAKAETKTSPIMNGTAEAKIQAGQTTKVTITLTPGGLVATELVVTFRFDKAFVEPCMRHVLKQVMDFAKDHKDQKLLIVGHTDLVGSPDPPSKEDPYNQSLSERRARAVYAFLTFGRDQAATDAAVADWNALRQKQSGGGKATLADNWGTREYQYMLQDLGFYPGAVDGKEGKKTQEAVRAFRCHSGLPPGTVMDDPAWDRLIRVYLGQDNFALTDDRFLRNCGNEALKWIGCASQDAVDPKKTAHRPNRRVELLFTTDSKLPCEVPQPDTFDLPTPGAVGSGWCVGPGDKNNRACFVVRHLAKDPKPQGKEWTRVLAEPGTIDVQVAIKKEVRNADGSIELKPAPGEKFVIVTGDGHFLKGEQSRGEPNPDTTSDGTKSYSDQALGFYSIAIEPKPDGSSVLVQLEGDPGADARGNEVCKHLTADDNTLNVVILLDPVLRQVKLPAVAHLMRALNPVTRSVRIAGVFEQQKTEHVEADIKRAALVGNDIWRPARVRFDLVDVVEEQYAFSVDGDVTDQEFELVLQRCAYPKAVNIFFVRLVSSTTRPAEPGLSVPELGLAVTIPGGCAVADLFPVTETPLTDPLFAQILAHELGHFLSLEDTSSDAPNDKRLMFPAVGVDADRKLLVADEVAVARGSAGAAFECVPLSISVEGATRVGGSLSHEFILIQDATKVVTLEAQISDELLAVGTLNMTGGNPGANSRERTVSGAAAGPPVEIVATYTPNGGGEVISTRKLVSVVTFDLRVVADGVRELDATTFLIAHDTGRVAIVADLQPAPFSVAKTIVEWKGGEEADDFLRRAVRRNVNASTTVSATIAGVTKSVTIIVFELGFVSNTNPAGPHLATLLIEGVLNQDLKTFQVASLFSTQRDSLFRARAILPTLPPNPFPATITHRASDGSLVRVLNLTLTKTGDNFLSPLPLLPVPAILKDELKQPTTLDVFFAHAGDTLTLSVPQAFGGVSSAAVTIRGRVVFLFAETFTDVSTSAADINATVADVRRQIARDNRIWAQAGIEVRERSIQIVADPGGLLELDDNGTNVLTADEQRLIGQIPGGPAHSATGTDLNVYYVKDIHGPPSGLSYKGRVPPCAAIEGPSVTDSALAHETGHWLLVNGLGDNHTDQNGVAYPSNNVLHVTDTGGGDVDQGQVTNILPNVSPILVVLP